MPGPILQLAFVLQWRANGQLYLHLTTYQVLVSSYGPYVWKQRQKHVAITVQTLSPSPFLKHFTGKEVLHPLNYTYAVNYKETSDTVEWYRHSHWPGCNKRPSMKAAPWKSELNHKVKGQYHKGGFALCSHRSNYKGVILHNACKTRGTRGRTRLFMLQWVNFSSTSLNENYQLTGVATYLSTWTYWRNILPPSSWVK
jgi:hypothetical protein